MGHTLRGPKLHGAQLEGSKTLRGKFSFNLCPAEFLTPQSKKNVLNFFKVSLVNHCHFRDLYNQYDHYEGKTNSRDGTLKDHTGSRTKILYEYITTTQ